MRHYIRFLPLAFILNIVAVSANTDIITNPYDERTFEFFTLENQLKVLLISDPDAEKSAAALDVFVGSGEDPVERFGLAHFLEHMLFLGTEKYPTPGEFQDFVEGHGGSHNAYTSLMHTNYFFDVGPDSFEQSLDRFASFFTSPLFLEQYVGRERQAVHSEYTSKLNQGSRREKDVFRELVNPGHALAKFATGSEETLGNIEPEKLREALIDFYQRYYSANVMTLVVTSSHSVSELKAMVESSFTDIKNTGIQLLTKEKEDRIALFSEDFLPAEIHINPKKMRRKLSIAFPIVSADLKLNEKPLHYIGNLLGHEGQGSLFSILKNKGWATALSAGTHYQWRSGEMFGINVLLTDKGYQHIDYVYALVFETIDRLKSKGVESWRFQELKDLSKTFFDYGERGEAVREASRLAHQLHETPAKDIFWASYDFKEFDEKVILGYLDQLQKDKALVTVVAPEVEKELSGNSNSEGDQNLAGGTKSHFYGTPYRIVKRENSLLRHSVDEDTANALSQSLELPKKNPFIAQKFKIIEASDVQAKQVKPEIVYENNNVKGWHLNDNIYDLPKTSISARLKLPTVAESAENFVATKIYARMLKDALNETSYNAALAGLSYSIAPTSRGIDIDFYGYSDSIGALSKRVLGMIRRLNRSKRLRQQMVDEFFPYVRKELLRVQRNRKHGRVYSQALADVAPTLYSPYWTSEEIEIAFENMTQPKFSKVMAQLFDKGTLEVFVFGNISKRQAKKQIALMAKLIDVKNDAEVPKGRVANVSQADSYIQYRQVDSNDSAVITYYQGLEDSLDTRVRMSLMEKILSTPIYRSLRTEQQLGYIVFSANYPMKDVPGMLVIVQSPNHSAEDVYKKIRKFFVDEEATLFANFERDKRALMLEISELPKNQIEWSDAYWNSILEDDDDFDRIQRALNSLKGITVEAMITDYKQLFINRSPNLTFVASKQSPKPNAFGDALKPVIDNQKFKAEMPGYLYP